MLLTYGDANFLLHKTLTLQHLDVKFSCRFIVLKRSYNNHWLIVRANGMHRVCHGGKSTGNWGEKEAKTTKPLPCRHMWWATIRRLPCPRRARARFAPPAIVTLTCLPSMELVCLGWAGSFLHAPSSIRCITAAMKAETVPSHSTTYTETQVLYEGIYMSNYGVIQKDHDQMKGFLGFQD